ncbi:hypothetical protein FHR71_004809 [Methylobacterium sp. RAS18]|nr:hypothetical protein [Methylobacterium sp. RAS18]
MIHAERLAEERVISGVKWFEYRFISAVQATELFYETYIRLYREAFRRDFDAGTAVLKRAVPVGGLWSSSGEFSAAWRARQIADGFGMPYDFFIRECIAAGIRRGVTRVPRPNQLYNLLSIPHLQDRWAEHCKAMTVFSQLRQYRVEAFCGLPAQLEHQRWVIGSLKARHARPFAIAQACFVDRIFTLDRAKAEFDPYVVERMLFEATGMKADPAPALRATNFLPSCFGLPHACSPSISPCIECHVREECRTAEAKVRGKVARRYGSEKPRDEEKLAQNRERVARCRAKKTLSGAAAVSQELPRKAPEMKAVGIPLQAGMR